MGRTKNRPVQREEGAQGSEVLGVARSGPKEEDSPRENEMVEEGMTTNALPVVTPTKKRTRFEGIDSDEEDPDIVPRRHRPRSARRRSIWDRFQQIEQEHNEKEERRLTKRRQRQRAKKNKKEEELVTYEGTESIVEVPTEVDLKVPSGDTRNDVNPLLILVKSSPSPKDVLEQLPPPLQTFELSHAVVEVVDNDKQPRTVFLRTESGVRMLMDNCVSVTSAVKGGDDDICWKSVGLAVEQGTCYCQLKNSDEGKSIQIAIGLVPNAILRAGDPQSVIVQPRSKKQLQQPTSVLSRALAPLFPDSIFSDITRHPSKSQCPDANVSAKEVYSLVDNQQYRPFEMGHNNENPTIPLAEISGLVPKLRPYQEAAVQWMLQRERDVTIGTEWKLAWYVVCLRNGLCEPLHAYGRTDASLNDKDYLLHCPFTGWWVASYEQAKRATLVDETALPSKGGILAESMGLGKTVEVLACILANRRVGLEISHEASTFPHSMEDPNDEAEICATETCSEGIPKQDSVSVKDAATNLDDSSTATSDKEFEFDGDLSTVPGGNTKGDPQPAGYSKEIMIRTVDLDSYRQPLGVCICGQSILVDEKMPINICEKCQEPMHSICIAEPVSRKETVRFRYGTKKLDCQVCSQENCPCCVSRASMYNSRATLIVTPPAILNQWKREIQRHTSLAQPNGGKRPLKVVVYPGIKVICNQQGNKGLKENCALVHPRFLGDADVVLMTFDALMGDLNHSDDNPFVDSVNSPARSLRHRKLYRVIPSPLLSIRWWRVCLDEAQRIETPTAATSKMALKLHAEHRWCVSGTPLGRGNLEDLYGLLLFQRLEPFCNKLWFNACFRSHHRHFRGRIVHLLKSVLWRSTKASPQVLEQMAIPQQIEKKVLLEFNSVEKHFYQRQYEETLNAAAELQSREKNGKRRSLALVENLSHQMHKLRAACCHPQVGSGGLVMKRRRGGFGRDDELQGTSRILTMDQILDRLIDDSRLKAEEALRVCLLHNNAMAALSKLKVEAKECGVSFSKSNYLLLTESYKLYMDTLKLLEDNSKPTSITGEAILTGCTGFQSPKQLVRGGHATLAWRLTHHDEDVASRPKDLWSRFDFDGSSKKITEIKVRHQTPRAAYLQEDGCIEIYPKTCIFQVLSSIGSFVDVVKIELPRPSYGDTTLPNWAVAGNFRTNRSKSWRLYIQDYHNVADFGSYQKTWFCGVEVELSETFVGGDSLQRLHALHNVSVIFDKLLDMDGEDENDSRVKFFSKEEMNKMSATLRGEAKEIEKLYMKGILPTHTESQRLLQNAISDVNEVEGKILSVSDAKKETGIATDFWEDRWWNDILLLTAQQGSSNEQHELCRRVHEDLNSAMEGAFDRRQLAAKPFPQFDGVYGLYQALDIRVEQDFRPACPPGALMQCLHEFKFDSNPTEASILESSTCERCKKDWTWTGAMCTHCKLSIRLMSLEADRLILIVLESIYSWMKGARASITLANARSAAMVDQRARLFFEALETSKKAKSAAEKAWRVHLDLLNDMDELNMCKTAMRLSIDGEDLSLLTEAQLNGVVHPIDVASSFLDHDSKQASALATLRRHTNTLRYLQNQSKERAETRTDGEEAAKTEEDYCMLCLSKFEGQRAVLCCGHSFHYFPCLERLFARSGSGQSIACPLRCSTHTRRDQIMVATDKSEDLASMNKTNRDVEGSWGTKVTRLVSDVLDVTDRGEKSVVFSQWEMMLDVIESALKTNAISFVRVTSLAKIGQCMQRFRAHDCSVILLNVKNGAEGLTLVEASHIFMVEPLMNCGMDLQAINRIHRIGQMCKTYVHRYLIQGTIEVNIDRWRMEHQEDQLEDSQAKARPSKSAALKAGGIDGSFSSPQEVLNLLKLEN